MRDRVIRRQKHIQDVVWSSKEEIEIGIGPEGADFCSQIFVINPAAAVLDDIL
jgi:hypothetical protein